MNLEGLAGGNFCLAKAGLGESAGTAGAMKIAAPNGAGVDYVIDGVLYHKADSDNVAFTAHSQIADGKSALILVQIDAAGTVSTKQSNIETKGSGVPLVWPQADASKCALGGVRIDCSGGTFTAGTTDLSGTGVTDTWYDFFANPAGAVAA